MVKRRVVAWTAAGLSACVGVLLSAPIWMTPLEHWQAHLERQAQWQELAQSVHDLRQTASEQSSQTPTPTTARDASPQAMRTLLDQQAKAQGASGYTVELGQALPVRGAWLCPFEIQAAGAVVPWLRAWQSLAQTQEGSVWMAADIRVLSPQQTVVHLHWYLPCRIESSTASVQLDDPFSEGAWQNLHAQRAQAHPSFAAVSTRWQQARTAQERFSLDQAHYIGRMVDGQKQTAVIQVRGTSAEALTYGVQAGDPLGANLGTVTRVDAQSVDVQEWWRDASGVWRSRWVHLPWEGD